MATSAVRGEYDAILHLLGAGSAVNTAATTPSQNKSVEEDLFGDEGSPDIKAQMAAKQAEKKATKKVKAPVIAKSSVTLEAMPYDAEVEISGMYETHVKNIKIDGLVWGPTAKVTAGPYGIKKLAFGCAIEDEKVTLEQIEEAVEILCMKPEDAQRYCEMRRSGELEDHEETWADKKIGTVKVLSFQKI